MALRSATRKIMAPPALFNIYVFTTVSQLRPGFFAVLAVRNLISTPPPLLDREKAGTQFREIW